MSETASFVPPFDAPVARRKFRWFQPGWWAAIMIVLGAALMAAAVPFEQAKQAHEAVVIAEWKQMEAGIKAKLKDPAAIDAAFGSADATSATLTYDRAVAAGWIPPATAIAPEQFSLTLTRTFEPAKDPEHSQYQMETRVVADARAKVNFFDADFDGHLSREEVFWDGNIYGGGGGGNGYGISAGAWYNPGFLSFLLLMPGTLLALILGLARALTTKPPPPAFAIPVEETPPGVVPENPS